MDKATLLDDVLGGFTLSPPDPAESIKAGGCVTIWLPKRVKARYDRLQERSGRQFSKKARDLLVALIDLAERRTA